MNDFQSFIDNFQKNKPKIRVISIDHEIIDFFKNVVKIDESNIDNFLKILKKLLDYINKNFASINYVRLGLKDYTKSGKIVQWDNLFQILTSVVNNQENFEEIYENFIKNPLYGYGSTGTVSPMLFVLSKGKFPIINDITLKGIKLTKLSETLFKNKLTTLTKGESYLDNKKLFDQVMNDWQFKNYEELDSFFYTIVQNSQKKQNENIESDGDVQMQKNNQTYPLNQILYGPPGTGKTYNTINKALEIIDKKVPENREEVKKRFDELKESGQIEFITFHQSYGYEEFVEGLKAKTDDENNIQYSVEPGIFKRLCDKASTKSGANIDEKIKWLKDELSDGETIEMQTKRGKQFRVSYNGNDTFQIQPNSSNSTYPVGIEQMKKFYKGEQQDIYNRSYTEGILEYLYENGLEKYSDLEDTNDKNYILIIDEINRGNISKIFGELITLIEPSKRIGADEEIRVQLPYSDKDNESFGVPKNLYIMGTMNTADRSIALMDTALRRRFEFVEMMPKPDTLENENIDGINLKELLETINKRIEYLYDRDHTIGHAYFMGIENLDDLKNAMRNKVIPLLQEYFYDDWEKIRLVLGDNQKEEEHQFIKIKKDFKKNELFGTKGLNDLDIDDEVKIYEINKEAFEKAESYTQIYDIKDKADESKTDNAN